jgi:hypothetical protein
VSCFRALCCILGCCLAAALLGAGCANPTGADGAAPDLRGTWSYRAQQGAPVVSLSGTMIVSGESGRGFNGQLQAVETNQAGIQRELSGIVTGSVTNASTVDFDAFLEQTGRRHVGRLAGDSITGSWVDNVGSDVPLTGTFKLRRAGQP